jgi:hypothetical protein
MKYNILFLLVVFSSIITFAAVRGVKEEPLVEEKPSGLKAGSFLTDYQGKQWVIENRELESIKDNGTVVYTVRISFVQQIKK